MVSILNSNLIKEQSKYSQNLEFFQENKVITHSKEKIELLASCVVIKFLHNNIFCTLYSISGKKTFCVRSLGIRKLKGSKRKLFSYSQNFLKSFLHELQHWQQKYKTLNSKFFFNVKIPKKLRKRFMRMFLKTITFVNFEFGKAFNGCRVKKKRRKKRLGFRSFK